MAERVLVLDRTSLWDGDWPQGYVPLGPKDAARLTRRCAELARFEDRAAAEVNPAWKQLIPYCVLMRGEQLFVMRRRKQSTESRLHGNHSLGIGGHVGPEDGPPDDPELLRRGLHRELREEVFGLDRFLDRTRLVGLLNDDSDPVGEVHAGFVYRLDLPIGRGTESIQIREISKLSGGFRRLVEIQDLWQDPGGVESWSLHVFDALFNVPPHGGIPHSSTESSKGYVREEFHDGGTHPEPEP